MLPDSIAFRKKVGVAVPARSWLRDVRFRQEMEKENITGIAYEPWHMRYVGKSMRRGCTEIIFHWKSIMPF